MEYIKKRVFLDTEIKMKIKIDLFQAAIGSILKYGIATLRTTESMGRELRQFYSRCLREIVYPTGRSDGGRQETSDFIRRNSACVRSTHKYEMGNPKHI